MFTVMWKRWMAKRKQELEYIYKFNNEWQFKAYEASLRKNRKTFLGVISIGLAFIFGYTNLIKPLLDVFA